ncbi:MAG: hypothetical protein EGS06_08925 [Megamonas funiformis]|nr:hypothetical protein [Megamonas funiformis]
MYILIGIVIILLFIWICNKKYKNSNYFLDDYNKIKKFVDGVPENLEIVNTGSNHAYYGFNYGSIKCFNFASGAQSLNYDYKILKQYSNNLNGGCKVLIVLAPLSFGFVDYKNDSSNSRYYFFMDKDKILNYSKLKKFLYVNIPILKSWKNFIRIFLRKKEIKSIINTPDNAEKEALLRINGWKKQFNLKNLLDKKSASYLKDEFENVKTILLDMIEFSLEHNWHPIIVIPPASVFFTKKISDEFMKEVLYDNIRFLKDKRIPILDYWKDDRLNDYKLYINSDFLNEKGSKLFTEIVLEDIKKLDKA